MLRDPLAFANRICRRVGLRPVEHEQTLDRWARRVQDTNNEDFVEAECSKSLSRPDHEVRLGRWRENLATSDVERLIPLLSETASEFDYQLQA